MPAYVQHHEVETLPIMCPGCIGLLPMFVRDVEPHWSLAKIDFIYECSDCGAEVRPQRATTRRRAVSATAPIRRQNPATRLKRVRGGA